MFNSPTCFDSCSAESPQHCPGWTAHQRRVIMTWSTSNWSRSQRWPSPRAAARASTPRTALRQPVSSPPTACLSVATFSTHGAPPSEQRTSSFFSLSLSFFPSYFFPPTPPPLVPTQVTFQSNRVDVHHRVETDYLEKNKIWLKTFKEKNKKKQLKTRNTFKTICSDFHQLHGIIYDCRLT